MAQHPVRGPQSSAATPPLGPGCLELLVNLKKMTKQNHTHKLAHAEWVAASRNHVSRYDGNEFY